MSNKVIVIDSMMGTGKTSYAIQLMQEAPINQKFIYVTPFLDEVNRIQSAVRSREFKDPNTQHGSGTKLRSLKRLISSGADIVTTHSLLSMADDELMELLHCERYMLIVDEVMDVVTQLPVRKGDIQMMLKGGAIEIDQATSRVLWKEHPKFDTTFSIVRDYAIAGNLYAVKSNTAFVWNFPAKMFGLFDQVFIMTYLFDGQLQRYFYDLHGIQYDYFAVVNEVGRYVLKPKSEVPEDRTHFKELIQIYDGKLNEIGCEDYALSKSWFDNKDNKEEVKKLKNNLSNFFRHITNANAESFLWTTYKDAKHWLKGNGFSKEEPENNSQGEVGKACFTSFNLRATNKYKHKTVLAFCLNRFIHPIKEQFFSQHNVKVDENLLALSDLLQWIFRSAVRDGKPIRIYIPSRRMRDLLKRWLNNEI